MGPESVRSCGRTPDPGPNGSSLRRPKKPRWVRWTSVPGHTVVLLVDVDRWVRVLAQHPVRSPRRRGSARRVGSDRPGRRPGRPLGRSSRTTLAGWRADRALVFRRLDHVVRRSHDRREVADVGRVEAQRAEGTDLGHGTFRMATRRRRLRDDGIVRYGRRWRDHPRAPASGAALARNFRSGAGRPCSDHRQPNPSTESSCASLPDQDTAILRRHTLRRSTRTSFAMAAARDRHRRAPDPSRGRGRPHDGGEALLDGHARVGAWMAIDVHIKNDGPAITGELRMTGGAQGRTRFWTAVDLPTLSDKTFLLYAQPPAFGRGARGRARRGGRDHRHDQGLVHHPRRDPAHRRRRRRTPRRHRRGDRPPAQPEPGRTGSSSPLDPADLPERVEAWGGLDRLVWQDVDSNRLSTGSARRAAWLAGGRWPPRHRRRDGGPETLSGLPRRSPAVPPDRDRRAPRPADWPGCSASSRPARPTCRRCRRRARPRAGRPRHRRRPRGRRRTRLRQRRGDAGRLRPDRRHGSPTARPARRCGGASCPTRRTRRSGCSATTASSSRPCRSCRRWPCRRSAG